MTDPIDAFRPYCDLEWAQVTINNLTTAFYRTSNHLHATTELAPEYLDMIRVPEAILDMITELQTAETWDQMKYHPEHEEGCEVCLIFGEA